MIHWWYSAWIQPGEVRLEQPCSEMTARSWGESSRTHQDPWHSPRSWGMVVGRACPQQGCRWQNWEWLIQLWVLLPLTGSSAGWRNGLWRNSPIHWHTLEPSSWKNPLVEKALGSWTGASSVTQTRLMSQHQLGDKGDPSLLTQEQCPALGIPVHRVGVQLEARKGFRDCSSSPWAKDEAAGTAQPGESSGRHFPACTTIWSGAAKRMEPGSCQWCPETGQEGVGTEWTGEVPSVHKNRLLLWGWLGTAPGCPGRQNVLPWRSGHLLANKSYMGRLEQGAWTWLSEVPSQPQPTSGSVNKQKQKSFEKNGKAFFFSPIKRSWTA